MTRGEARGWLGYGLAMTLAVLGGCADEVAAEDGDTGETADSGTETGGSEDPCAPGPSSLVTPTLDWRVDYEGDEGRIISVLAVRPGGGVVAAGPTAYPVVGIQVFELDVAGAELWRTTLFPDQQLNVRGLAIDADGVGYLAGSVNGALDGQTSAGEGDAFVVAISPEGELAWARQWGTAQNDRVSGLAIGRPGELFITGDTAGDFAADQAGGGDAFLMRVDRDGEQIWTRQWGGAYLDWPRGITASCESEVYVVGAQFLSEGSIPFVAHYDAAGEEQWRRLVPVTDDGNLYDVALLGDDIYASGVETKQDEWNNSSKTLVVRLNAASGVTWTTNLDIYNLGGLVTTSDGILIGHGPASLVRLDTEGVVDWSTGLEPGDTSHVGGMARGSDGALYLAADPGSPTVGATVARFVF